MNIHDLLLLGLRLAGVGQLIFALRRRYFYQTLALNALFIAQTIALMGALAWDLGIFRRFILSTENFQP